MEKDIRQKLIELARLKTTWSYSTLNFQLELGFDFGLAFHRQQIGELLGEISVHEFNKGRPLLSALITHQTTDREQGDGFFKLCGELYDKDWRTLKNDTSFENEKIRECYEFWKSEVNYKMYKDDF